MAQNSLVRGIRISRVYKLAFLLLTGLFAINLLTPSPVLASNSKISDITWYKDSADAFNETSLSFKIDDVSGFSCRFILEAVPDNFGDPLGSDYLLKQDPGGYRTFDALLTDNCASPPGIPGIIVSAGNTYTINNLKLVYTPTGIFDETFVAGIGDYININGLTISLNNVFSDTENYYFNYTDEIIINYPVNNSNITDFSDWDLSYRTDITDAYINIYYTNGSVYYSQLDPYFSVPAVTELTNIIIPKYNILTYGTWTITAILNSESLPDNLAINISVFEISVTGESGVPVVSCEGGNWIADAFCEVLTYLFVPSSTSLNRFSTLSDDIKNKPPMGYFLAVKSAFGDIGESATPAFVLEGLSALDDIFIPIKNGLIFIFWLSFSVWLYNRIRHFEL